MLRIAVGPLPEPRQGPTQPFHGSAQLRFDAFDGDPKRVGDVRVGHMVVPPEDRNGALALGQPLQCGVEGLHQFTVQQRVVRRVESARQSRCPVFRGRTLDHVPGIPIFSNEVDRVISRGTEEVRLE